MSLKEKPGLLQNVSPISLILMGIGMIIIAIAVIVFANRGNSISKEVDDVNPVPGFVNYKAPELSLTDMADTPVSLESLNGLVVLVNNWAAWCPPCRAEMPVLESYFRAHKGESFTLVGINSGDRHDQVEDFVREYGLTFPMWLDPTGIALRVFQNNALPSTYIIDKSGVVRYVWMGAVSLEALENYVTPLINE